MDDSALYPFNEYAHLLVRHCLLPLHVGKARINQQDTIDHPLKALFNKFQDVKGKSAEQMEFTASIFVPAAGNCKVILRCEGECPLSKNFGEGLTITGQNKEVSFEFYCKQYYVEAVSESQEKPGWAVLHPVNQPAQISYGEPRPIAFVTATINNFDFEQGNASSPEFKNVQDILRVEALGRSVDFAWRPDREKIRKLADAGFINHASFTNVSFQSWTGATEDDLQAFALNVSILCTYVVGQHMGIPVLSFFDANGIVIRRVLADVIESELCDGNAIRFLHFDSGLPQLFKQCFEEHCRMQKSELWNHFPSFFASLEDSPYLEQKFSTLMSAVELLIRSSLIEGGHLNSDEAKGKTLPTLIGMARTKLRWDVPKHYTEDDRYRITRNAVDHGDSLPHSGSQVRADFDKWKLFLTRRLFIRLGFDGHVASPKGGWASSSPVHEFSETHNSFDHIASDPSVSDVATPPST